MQQSVSEGEQAWLGANFGIESEGIVSSHLRGAPLSCRMLAATDTTVMTPEITDIIKLARANCKRNVPMGAPDAAQGSRDDHDTTSTIVQRRARVHFNDAELVQGELSTTTTAKERV